MAALVFAAGPASAQLLGRGGDLRLPELVPPLPTLQPGRALSELTQDLDPQRLLDARLQRLADFVRAHRATVEVDPAGQPVVRGEALALAPDPATLEAAEREGFTVLRRETLDPLGVEVVVLRVPHGLSVRKALRRLRELDPAGSFDYDHLYFESGAVSVAGAAVAVAAPASRAHVRAGLVDTGVDARHPALAGAEIEQRGFAPGGPVPAAHGTAVASLIAGSAGAFRGAAPGASLFVADVYGRGGAGGSAEDVARALAWMAQVRAPVVNVSLVGPDNRLLAATVHALTARGQVVVAAVGNDGPAAPPMYPASYADVVAVSAVDARGRPLLEDGRADHVDVCAPGADMAAAAPGSGYAAVRGTSFAAPIVAGLLVQDMAGPEPGRAQAVLDAAAKRAVPPAGDRKACGRGVVGADLRIAPKAVGARAAPTA